MTRRFLAIYALASPPPPAVTPLPPVLREAGGGGVTATRRHAALGKNAVMELVTIICLSEEAYFGV